MTLANWAMQQGTPADQRGPLDAPAGDGVCNLLKFAYGVAPMTKWPSSGRTMGEIAQGTGDNRHLALSFIRNSAAQGIVLELEVSTDLQTWVVVPSTLAVVFPNGPGSDIVRLRETAPLGSASRRFARLAVRLVP
ncbi:MAG: hypothetical protein IPL39_19955 [Opitutaceae bacterium]|nr:hypothetical protein [Opitutaceae bacterium]